MAYTEQNNSSYLFEYTECTVSTMLLTPGVYQFEVWGASANMTKGLGGYSSGFLRVRKPLQIFIHLGGMGSWGNGIQPGGCNGGGDAKTQTSNVSSGGGGTDIRAYQDTLYHRFIVAGGGGGGDGTYYGGGVKGGEFAGGDGRGRAGNQTHPGIGCWGTDGCDSGSFGYGGNATSVEFGGGGGGGWYGGASGSKRDESGWYGAAGGSGYVLNETSNKPVNYALGKEMYMFNTQLIDGNQENIIPNYEYPNEVFEKGNSGNGAARITFIAPLFCKTFDHPIQHMNLMSLIMIGFVLHK